LQYIFTPVSLEVLIDFFKDIQLEWLGRARAEAVSQPFEINEVPACACNSFLVQFENNILKIQLKGKTN